MEAVFDLFGFLAAFKLPCTGIGYGEGDDDQPSIELGRVSEPRVVT